MNLAPYPRRLKRGAGTFVLPAQATVRFDSSLKPQIARAVFERLQSVAKEIGVEIKRTAQRGVPTIRVARSNFAPEHFDAYTLEIKRSVIEIHFGEIGGLHAAVSTLRQLLREHGKALPCVRIDDHADFEKRGVMLDISRGRVPRLETLMELAGHLADFKINELQLYTEHTFAYRKYRAVWEDWGALTGAEIEKLDARCRDLGIELVPNQNSFGHLREFLAYPSLRKLAEVSKPWPDDNGAFLRYPSTLTPNNPGTLPFLRGLYDELLPNFSSKRFNLGCDETWDLGRGQSRELCERIGKGRVYLDFLKKIHAEVKSRKKQMMFWGDIILHHPELVRELPRDCIALNWGYEAGHPFNREAAIFARSKIPFYVCPGTSTWMTLIGRHDNAIANLREAAKAGRKHGAKGYLITDWGDGGHSNPLAVSYVPYLYGASESWCGKTAQDAAVVAVLNRDIFRDPKGFAGQAAHALGFAHKKLKFRVLNLTPLGAVIAAPPPHRKELFCRDGLKYYAQIKPSGVQDALDEVEEHRSTLHRAHPANHAGETLAAELDFAARMAAHSCRFMLWQQAVAAGKSTEARSMSDRAVVELRQLDQDFTTAWPARNKATPKHCSAFLQWRIRDYLKGR